MSGERNVLQAGPMPRRAILGGLAALPAAAGAVPASHPDAALIAACAALPGLIADLNTRADWDDDACPWRARYDAALDIIGEAEPQTLAGWLAKAEAARIESLDLAGEESPEDTLSAQWAWSLMHDMRRLVAAGVVR